VLQVLKIRLYRNGVSQLTEIWPLRGKTPHRRVYKEGVDVTQALRRVYDRRIYVLDKDMPNKREREVPSQNGLENEGEVLPNLALDLNAATIAVTLSYS
jgi:hypothetical protein